MTEEGSGNGSGISEFPLLRVGRISVGGESGPEVWEIDVVRIAETRYGVRAAIPGDRSHQIAGIDRSGLRRVICPIDAVRGNEHRASRAHGNIFIIAPGNRPEAIDRSRSPGHPVAAVCRSQDDSGIADGDELLPGVVPDNLPEGV